MSIKIAVLGGSGTSTPRFVQAIERLLGSDGHGGRDGHEGLRVTLIGRNREKLAAVARISQALAPQIDVTWDDVLERGIEGASIVLNQIRVGGLEGRAWDEQAPRSIGLFGEETMGAGGFALGYRTLPVIRAMAQAIERYAPDAWFINLSNPADLVATTLAAETRVRAVSLCDVPVTMEQQIRAVATDVRIQEIRVFGVNHVNAVISVRDAEDREVLPDLLARVAEANPQGPYDALTLETLGFLPSPYLRFLLYPELYAPTTPVRHSRADELLTLQDQLLEAYQTDHEDQARALLSARNPHWYEEVVVPVIASLLAPDHATASLQVALQMPNRGRVPFVKEHAVVETTMTVTAGEIIPLDIPPIPPEIKHLTVQLTEAHELARQATLENNPDLAIRALALTPLVPSLTKAREFWRLFSSQWLDH